MHEVAVNPWVALAYLAALTGETRLVISSGSLMARSGNTILTTLRDVNLVIDQGRVVEDGSPAFLRHAGGVFERMWVAPVVAGVAAALVAVVAPGRLMLAAPIPWAERCWALPFRLVLASSERYYLQRQLLFMVRRWVPVPPSWSSPTAALWR